MKILFVTKKNGSKTGAGTYADLLIERMKQKHDVKVYESEEDLQEKWDIIHVTDLKHVSNKLLKKLPKPVVLDVHDYYWMKFYPFFCLDFPLRFLFQKYRKVKYGRLLKKADAIITHCKYVNDMITHKKKYVVWIGIKPEPLVSQDETIERENLILFVGRDYFRKGIYPLLKALPLVLREVPDARLLVVGKEYKHSIRFAKFLSRGLPVEFVDGMARDALLKIYKTAKVFVLPSHIEAVGIVNLEAMASGTPIVASRVGGIPEVITNGENGLLVDAGDYQGLSRAIIRCFKDRSLTDRLTKKGYERFQSSFLVQYMIESVESVYRDIVRDPIEAKVNTIKL